MEVHRGVQQARVGVSGPDLPVDRAARCTREEKGDHRPGTVSSRHRPARVAHGIDGLDVIARLTGSGQPRPASDLMLRRPSGLRRPLRSPGFSEPEDPMHTHGPSRCGALAAALVAALAAPGLLAQDPAAAQPTPSNPTADIASALPWRELGPANMGGRVTDIAVHDAHPSTWYVATAGGTRPEPASLFEMGSCQATPARPKDVARAKGIVNQTRPPRR